MGSARFEAIVKYLVMCVDKGLLYEVPGGFVYMIIGIGVVAGLLSTKTCFTDLAKLSTVFEHYYGVPAVRSRGILSFS